MRDQVNHFKIEMPYNMKTFHSKSKLNWEHDDKNGPSSVTTSSKLVLRRTRTPTSPIKKMESTRSLANQKFDLEHKRKLWRVFRRKMNEERKSAIEVERQLAAESDGILQLMEEEKELQTAEVGSDLVHVDSEDERSRYEMLLPSLFDRCDPRKLDDYLKAEDVDKEKGVWSFHGGLLDLLHVLSGQVWRVNQDEDGDTASTTDETSIASHCTMESESEASWYSWQSGETQKVNNRGGTRELLMKHFGGENDSPWLAARRGDMNALESRWKHRHDWTLQDEHGNTPLYYGCRYGGAKNLRVVLFLLQQWPSTLHIPPLLMNRCKEEAANIYVHEILINPCHAEIIIRDYEENFSQRERHDDDNGSEDECTGGSALYNIFEDDDE